jgi:hypothetical protein
MATPDEISAGSPFSARSTSARPGVPRSLPADYQSAEMKRRTEQTTTAHVYRRAALVGEGGVSS